MLNIGDKAPDFSLPSDSGAPLSLREFKGSTVVLFFFPKADTPGCTRESQGFSGAGDEIKKLGARVIGMSADSPEKLATFRDKYDLKFPLVGDESHKTLEAYGVWQEKNNYGKKSMGIVRSTYIIDPEGKVKKVFPRVSVDGHVEKVVEALKQ